MIQFLSTKNGGDQYMMFRNIKKNSDGTPSTAFTFNFRKFLLMTTLGFCVVFYVLWQGIVFYQNISKNWQELSFAYNKPELVKNVRKTYEKKQRELDQTFTQTHQTEQDKLIQELTKQLKEERSKE